MHDMDRTTLEYGQEMSGFEAEQFEFGQGEWSGEGGANAMFSEAEEMELANELLSVSNEDELDQFLGNCSRSPRGPARLIRRPSAGPSAACSRAWPRRRCRWPAARSAPFGGPLGAQIGSGLASRPAARRPGGGAPAHEEMDSKAPSSSSAWPPMPSTRRAARGLADPRTVAQAAAIARRGCWRRACWPRARRPRTPAAAAAHAGAAMLGHATSSGRWARRGNTIVLYGA